MGSQGDASSSEVSPDSMDRWNWYTKLGPFFLPLLLTITFDQMTIKHSLYMQTYTSTIQKEPVVFFKVLGFTLEEKLQGKKCCEYYRPEGVEYN